MTQNRAAWFLGKASLDMEVTEAPHPNPGDGDVVIKACAVAVNPGVVPYFYSKTLLYI